jgi:transposase
MRANELFGAALQLGGTPWRVLRSDFSGEPPVLEIVLEFHRGSQFPCPKCGQPCGVHDTTQKRWRHLNFFQYRCELVADVPRVWCRQDGVHLVAGLPWASSGSGFTLLFEAFVMLLAQQMPVAAIARVVQEEDTRLWRLISRLVQEAHAASDWSQVSSVAIDETSSRRGRCYVTVFLDAQTHRLLYVAEGRGSWAVEEFAQALIAHQGDPKRIQSIAMDMLHCYAKGVREQFPAAQIVYDRFHLMVMAGEAVDEVRRSMQRQGAQLKGALWSLRGNPWNLDLQEQQTRQTLSRRYRPLGRALALRAALQGVYEASDSEGPELLKYWCRWAARSRLAPFRKLAKTFQQYWTGIVSYFQCRITQGAVEAINGIIQLAKRRARGFRNFSFLRTVAYLVAAKLKFQLPSLLPT